MRLLLAPVPLLQLITTILLAPSPVAAGPQPALSGLGGFSYDELFGRWDCNGIKCGYYDQLCCSAGSACYTNAASQAECTPNASGSRVAGPNSVAASASASATMRCHYALGECACGNTCCPSGQYCKKLGVCAPAYAGQTTTTATTRESGAVPGIRQTSYSSIVVTQTSTPTTTVHYETPVATGANITMTELHTSSSSLSGGAIAGIVIGVLVGLFLLALLCFYCCLKGIWDGLLSIFGVRRKRKVTEVDEYTRRTHYSSDGRKRTWYGAPVKKKTERRESHAGRDLVGVGAGLAALWAILGLKRRREDRRKQEQQEKYSEYSYSSDYYTSESSASSDDRRTERYSRQEVRRSDSRRP